MNLFMYIHNTIDLLWVSNIKIQYAETSSLLLNVLINKIFFNNVSNFDAFAVNEIYFTFLNHSWRNTSEHWKRSIYDVQLICQ